MHYTHIYMWFRPILKKSNFFDFLTSKKIFSHIYVKISNFRLNIGRITSAMVAMVLKLFPKSFPTLTQLFSLFNEKNQNFGILPKIDIFTKVLFLLLLLRFWVPRWCFFKSMIFQLYFAQKIIKKALLDQKLCQVEVWSTPF